MSIYTRFFGLGKSPPKIKRQNSIVGLVGNEVKWNSANMEMDAHLYTNINEKQIYSNFYKSLTEDEKLQ